MSKRRISLRRAFDKLSENIVIDINKESSDNYVTRPPIIKKSSSKETESCVVDKNSPVVRKQNVKKRTRNEINATTNSKDVTENEKSDPKRRNSVTFNVKDNSEAKTFNEFSYDATIVSKKLRSSANSVDNISFKEINQKSKSVSNDVKKESNDAYTTRPPILNKETESFKVDKNLPVVCKKNVRKRTQNELNATTNSKVVIENKKSDLKRKNSVALNIKDNSEAKIFSELPNDATIVSRKLRSSAKSVDNMSAKENSKQSKTVSTDILKDNKNKTSVVNKKSADPKNIKKDAKSDSKNITTRSNRLEVKKPKILGKKKQREDNNPAEDDDFKKCPPPSSRKVKGKISEKCDDVDRENVNSSESDSEFKVDEKETSSESDGESEWEEVPDNYEEPPKKRKLVEVQITISNKPGPKKSKIEQAMDEIRRRINRKLIQSQYDAHKVHLLCLLAIGFKMNSLGSNIYFRAMLLSLIPIKLMTKFTKKSFFDLKALVELRDWFLKTFPLQMDSNNHDGVARMKMIFSAISGRTNCCLSELEYIVMFVALCRSLGINTRILYSLQPLPYKAIDILKPRPLSTTFMKKVSLLPNDGLPDVNKKVSQFEKENVKKQEISKKMDKPKKKKSEIYEEDDDDDDDDDDDNHSDNDDFVRNKSRKRVGSKKKDRSNVVKNLDASIENNVSKKSTKIKKCDWWVEVYLESFWVTLVGPSFDETKPDEVEKRMITKPLSYILAFDTNNHVKDLTRKYDSNWLKTTSKSRLDEVWWCDTLKTFADDTSDESLEEDLLIHETLMSKPFPTSISEYKNHPLYALQRHLLKYEAIYPSNSRVLGQLKDEPIYARECVHTLCSREKWLIEGRMILPDQEPYKYVKALPKSGKQRILTNQMLGLYGKWQTDLYIAPPAVDGIVPKNNYDNVDLFKPWMLPKGTVHLKGTYYGMGKTARKAGIDAAPAMVGWEFHKGFNHPILDGWVVCEENKDALLDAWKIEHELEKERMREKKEKRVIGNWNKLVRHLLIRNKLRNESKSKKIDGKSKATKVILQKKVECLESDSESCSEFETVSDLSEPVEKKKVVKGKQKQQKKKD